jgi:TonB family protein
VRYIVDETGAITAPEVVRGDERFHAAALAAIKLWKYKPGTEDGKNVPREFEVDIEFTPNGPPETTSQFSPPYKFHSPAHHHPEERRAPDPVYPKHLEKRQLFGEVELTLAINPLGRVEAVEVVRATHADFLSAAFTAFEQWEFKPAMVGRLPVKGEQIAKLQFEVRDGETNRALKADWLENSGVTIRDPAAPKSAEYFDETPVALAIVDPVYPYDLLGKGVEGTARVNFSVSKEGEVIDIAVVEATEPDFGAALAAAMAVWKFKPLFHLGEKALVDFSILWKFAKPSVENTGPESLAALVPGENRAKAKELDRPLAPLFLLAAEYPKALKEAKTVGQANIEITINQSGRVCWPRIVSATQPEFGWAAATAVSRWYFETPMKGGKPVEVRAVIPVEFKPE